jgi:hypothetical protein
MRSAVLVPGPDQKPYRRSPTLFTESVSGEFFRISGLTGTPHRPPRTDPEFSGRHPPLLLR